MGLYLHVPFCLRKCPYCSFFSIAGNRSLHQEYSDAVEGQLRDITGSGWTGDRPVATIFVGGGTPSILPPGLLAALLQAFHRSFPGTDRERETSIEVNPATVTYPGLAQLREAGFNRVSVGVQSLDDTELRGISRPHTAADAVRTVAAARKAGFGNLNIDLMYGLPGQTDSSWRQTLIRALDLRPDHLAIYELTIEERTPFAVLQEEGRLNLPTEDEVVAMMAITGDMLGAEGFVRYEISNYALPGKECCHNINYWRNGWYVGLGPGAVSCLQGRRYTAVADVAEFCRRIGAGEEWWSDMEQLDTEARFRETVVMGLRMTAGVSMAELERRFGLNVLAYYGETLVQLQRHNLVEIRGDRLRLSSMGLALANQAMAALV